MLALLQGAFFAVTGIWPLISPGTFQKVTGPKVDFWLVKTVGILIAVIGSALMLDGGKRRVTSSTRLLAVGSSLGLAAIDVYYAGVRRISPVYLLDAVAELALAGAWIVTGRGQNSERG
ncbi:MAG: hypothetical protein GXY36_17165 [Chloroflexi bacterium]|nr:hypothetical protein [Chloroflexota bacterium]